MGDRTNGKLLYLIISLQLIVPHFCRFLVFGVVIKRLILTLFQHLFRVLNNYSQQLNTQYKI